MTDTSQPTGHHDRHGIPIHVGDLIRVEHYRHRRGRRLMWLYFRVAMVNGKTVVQNWDNLNPEKWQCLLKDCGIKTAEVVAEARTAVDKSGDLMTFNERPRKKANQ